MLLRVTCFVLYMQSDAPLELHTVLPQMSHIRVLGILACDFKWATFFLRDVADCCRKLQAFHSLAGACMSMSLQLITQKAYKLLCSIMFFVIVCANCCQSDAQQRRHYSGTVLS
jgi:hypothetical protein